MSQNHITRSNGGHIARLPDEIVLYGLLALLDNKDQQDLSRTCKWLYRFVRLNRFGVVSPIWEEAEVSGSINLPASCHRNGVVVNNVLYIPILTNEKPYCLTIDFIQRPLNLIQNQIKLDLNTKDNYEPCKFMATAVIGNLLYIFGGQNPLTEKPTNVFYELNINTFVLRKINNCQNLPKARMMHTLSSIDNHRLALFGGRCFINRRFFNTDEFAIYDTRQNSWTLFNEKNISRRSNHSTIFMNRKLYIYGGDQSSSFSTSNRTRNDDSDIWEYDTLKTKWKTYLSPKNGFSSNFLPENLIPTNGPNPLKRRDATIFPMHRQVAIFGGNEIKNDVDENKSWEIMEILSPTKRSWVHLRIQGMPRIEDIAIYKIGPKDVFIIGKDQKEGKTVMGWIKDNLKILVGKEIMQ